MQRYQNLNGDSGVTHYDIGEMSIRIRFGAPDVYVYDYSTPGRAHVEAMKQLALAGRGLATYINQHVRENFARKES